VRGREVSKAVCSLQVFRLKPFIHLPRGTQIPDTRPLWRLHILLWRLEFSGLATGWTVRGSNLGGGETFRTGPDRPWYPASLIYNESFPEVKRPERGVNHPPPSSAEFTEN